jgi:hypothetical protein
VCGFAASDVGSHGENDSTGLGVFSWSGVRGFFWDTSHVDLGGEKRCIRIPTRRLGQEGAGTVKVALK